MQRTILLIQLAAATEQQLRRTIHRRGDIVRRIEAIVEEGLQDLSRFTPRQHRRTAPQTPLTRTTVRLENDLVARLDTACQSLGVSRSALLEAMVTAHLQPPQRTPAKTTTCIHLDPAIEQPFRQSIHYRGDVSRVITDIIRAGLAANDRFAHVRRRPPGSEPRPYKRLVISVETELFAQLTQAAKRLGTSRTALLEAMIAARLNGDI
jgi:metal-responsive CopG/Arc/MetJ family transcriptional regulator